MTERRGFTELLPHRDGHLWVLCWCRRFFVSVTQAEVKKGYSASCDDECYRRYYDQWKRK